MALSVDDMILILIYHFLVIAYILFTVFSFCIDNMNNVKAKWVGNSIKFISDSQISKTYLEYESQPIFISLFVKLFLLISKKEK